MTDETPTRTPPEPYTDRSGDRIQVGARFPPAMHARLTASATKYGMSINQLLIELVDRALHHTDKKTRAGQDTTP